MAAIIKITKCRIRCCGIPHFLTNTCIWLNYRNSPTWKQLKIGVGMIPLYYIHHHSSDVTARSWWLLPGNSTQTNVQARLDVKETLNPSLKPVKFHMKCQTSNIYGFQTLVFHAAKIGISNNYAAKIMKSQCLMVKSLPLLAWGFVPMSGGFISHPCFWCLDPYYPIQKHEGRVEITNHAYMFSVLNSLGLFGCS